MFLSGTLLNIATGLFDFLPALVPAPIFVRFADAIRGWLS